MVSWKGKGTNTQDQIGKAAYNPELKDLIGRHRTLKKEEEMMTEPRQTRSKTKIFMLISFVMCSDVKFQSSIVLM